MTKSTGTRLYRACIRCRRRKIKCDLKNDPDNNYLPCSKCMSDGHRCVPASSRRGGDYSRFRNETRPARQPNTPSLQTSDYGTGYPMEDSSNKASVEDKISCGGIQNPLEALQILAHTAANEETIGQEATNSARGGDIEKAVGQTSMRNRGTSTAMMPDIVREGILDMPTLKASLQYYIETYHPFMPIVPTDLLHLDRLPEAWVDEKFLLAAVLTLATQERLEFEAIHAKILQYTERLILRVVMGARAVHNVGWSHLSETTEEDSVAWNLIGLAVRQAYLLHLERYSFRGEAATESDPERSRKRNILTLINTYIADRQISIQMGQAFWCRGPGLSTRFTVHDYPDLQPQKSGGIDYASFIQAQVELTTLFGNAHDILFASKSRTVQLMKMGDYTKYLDDSPKALDMWTNAWGNVHLPPHLNGLLTMQYEYLCLYINEFAFQAVLYRSSRESSPTQQDNYFPYSVMASPDGRHIYIAINAAKNVIKALMERLNPVKHLRFLPVRYDLYEIHASVSLFKAYSVGALTADESQSCLKLARQFISMLEIASTGPKHIAHRYGKLLAGLWFQGRSTQETSKPLKVSNVPDNRSFESPAPCLNHPLEESMFQPSFSEIRAGAGETPYIDTPEIIGNPDSFFSNLPFLRGDLLDLDESGIDGILMSGI
ncbi:hypothetical protein BO71DRAFT_449818 [Aspergillus ellipticus CBS 707.79]|uniref:Zn(2)-C6 fungal-type domain-containing protein n=1 Tax=Aspergillus ellipticus CBS 707.79 TaxID=1448320 RepID=A0A319DC91_9EURO|nr:hypothetical protein BO71DRAFT_449818 [Aspergillus ellipticus CBS 707.79]